MEAFHAAIESPDVQFSMIDGVRIRYADGGDSQEPTILLTGRCRRACMRSR
jgi:hypothetical protein